MRNYYKVLGVPERSTSKEIREAYHRMVKQWHPDRNPHNPLAPEMMKMYNEAYEVLSDPAKRSTYDASLETKPAAQGEDTEGHQKDEDPEADANARGWAMDEAISQSHADGYNMNLDAMSYAYSMAFSTPRREYKAVWWNLILHDRLQRL